MAGIRSFNSNAPTVFKYPEWVSGLFYPAGSVVAVRVINTATQVTYDFYAAKVDVTQLTTNPRSNAGEWRLVHDVDQIDSDIINRIQNIDSDIQILTNNMDSDYRIAVDHDSDLKMMIDSEHYARRYFEYWTSNRFDSEYRGRKDADSDNLAYLLQVFANLDSDVKSVLSAKNDSDWIRRLVAANVDSEIKVRLENDSDLNILIRQTIHDFLSGDSELDSDILELKTRLDSDFRGAVRGYKQLTTDAWWGPTPWLTNTRLTISTGTVTNHTGYLWICDQDNNTIYIVLDGNVIFTTSGDLTKTEIAAGNYGEFRRGTHIEESPGTFADVAIYETPASPTPLTTNANVFAVLDRLQVKQASATLTSSLDDALRRTVATVVEMDSDLYWALRKDSDQDSDIRQFRTDILALKASNDADRDDSDSDRIIQLFLRLDSEYRERKNTDSDLKVLIDNSVIGVVQQLLDFDSDITVAFDSEMALWRDHDSDILHGYKGVVLRYVVEEYEPPTIGLAPTIDFVGAVANVTDLATTWVWNTVNNRLVITDSDGTVLYNEIHLAEPTVVSVGERRYRRGTDSLQNADIQINGVSSGTDDIWRVHFDWVSKKFNGGIVRAIVDSEITLRDIDSDIIDTTRFIARRLAEIDSELIDVRRRDSDISNGYFGVVYRYDSDSDAPYARVVNVYIDSDITLHDLDSDNKIAAEFIANKFNEIDSDIWNINSVRNLNSQKYLWNVTTVEWIPWTGFMGIADPPWSRLALDAMWQDAGTFAADHFAIFLGDSDTGRGFSEWLIYRNGVLIGRFPASSNNPDTGTETPETRFNIGGLNYHIDFPNRNRSGITLQHPPGIPVRTIDIYPIGVEIQNNDQIGVELTTNRSKDRNDVDSDFLHNFTIIRRRLNDIDSDRPTHVLYRNDSDIQVRGIFFNNDSEGYLTWSSDDNTLQVALNKDVTLQIGQEQHFYIRADSDIKNGQIVMFAGSQGDHILGRLADHKVPGFKKSWIMGIATQDIDKNKWGFVTQFGSVGSLDTQGAGWALGDILYWDIDKSQTNKNATLTNVRPAKPNYVVEMAAVTRVGPGGSGKIFVRPTIFHHFDEIDDVQIVEHKYHEYSVYTPDLLVVGEEYEILTTGTTDFTTVGAANSNPHTIFVATNTGVGTGTVKLLYDEAVLDDDHGRVMMYDSDTTLWKNTRINTDFGNY